MRSDKSVATSHSGQRPGRLDGAGPRKWGGCYFKTKYQKPWGRPTLLRARNSRRSGGAGAPVPASRLQFQKRSEAPRRRPRAQAVSLPPRRPFSRTMIRSAASAVDNRWATVRTPHPSRSIDLRSAAANAASLALSIAAVASSRSNTTGSWTTARARASNCYCPAEEVGPATAATPDQLRIVALRQRPDECVSTADLTRLVDRGQHSDWTRRRPGAPPWLSPGVAPVIASLPP